jgi:acetyl esterase
MDKVTFKWSTLFCIAVLLTTGMCVTAGAGDNKHRSVDPYQDTISPITGRKGIELAILARKSAGEKNSLGYTMNSQTEKRREQPDYADVRYGPHERNTLDIWLAGNDAPTPLVIYFHGGGFSHGDKSSIRQKLLSSLLAAGISVAAVNYRLSSTAPYPAQMHDGARALQFLRHYAARYNIDPTRIGATGVSAGGGISLWLAFHEDLANPASKDPLVRLSTRLSAAVVYETQTTYDPREIMELFNTTHVDWPLLPFFGMRTAADVSDPDYHSLFVDASAINHLTTDDVPVMLYYSQADKPLQANSPGKDHIHHPRFGHLLKEKMDRLGIMCVLKLRKDYRNSSGNFTRDNVNFFVAVFNKKPPLTVENITSSLIKPLCRR